MNCLYLCPIYLLDFYGFSIKYLLKTLYSFSKLGYKNKNFYEFLATN